MARPPQVAYWLEEAPPALATLALALQQIAIQAIYLILPGLVARGFGLLALDVVNFLSLSVVAVALAGLLQALPRGPLGSGYPVASIPSPVFVAVYLLAAPGANLVVAGTLALVTGLVGLVLALQLKRMQAVVPTEVAGVVVFLIGISLLPRAFESLVGPSAAGRDAVLGLATLGVMIVLALVGAGVARFAVLIGAVLGTLAALATGIGLAPDTELLSHADWFALPRPELPSPDAFDASILPAFGLALLASFASWAGDLVAFQRAADSGWRRPDTPPIRRGLIAQSLAMSLAGLFGGMVPGTSSACVGLSIGTRILARRVTVLAALLLLLLACCPKLMALVVLLPAPVEAAMLGYVCCFMLATGCQLMSSRMLDARRTFTVGLGITAGMAALLDLPFFHGGLARMLAAPVTAGAALAVALNLVTAPLISRRAGFTLKLDAVMPRTIDEQVEALGGSWGARRETMQRLGHALLEVAEVLAARGVPQMQVQARHADDVVEAIVTWSGDSLPDAPGRPQAADLEGSEKAQEAFTLWLVSRLADEIQQRVNQGQAEIRLRFED